MALLTGQIAQFVVPSDAIGNPNTTLIDWPNQRFYMFNNNGIRSYSTVFATQNPILSVATAINNQQACAVDASGALIVDSLAAYISNGQPVYKISASTLLPGISFGASTSFPSYPASVWAAQSIVCLTVNGVSYGIHKEITANAAVYRTDTMTAAGAYIASSGGTNGKSFLCAGLNAGGTSATAFLLDQTLSGAYASVGVYKITVTSGAENYNIASWPTPNPDINGGLLTTLAAASVDASWTSLYTNSLGYDAKSNVVLVDVSAGNTVSVPRYLLALNATSGAIIWRLGLPAGSFNMNLPQTRITAASLPYLQYNASAAIYGIRTSDGQATINTVDGLYAGLPLPGMSSDDVSQIIISGVNPYTEAAGTPTPVSGTPSSFTGWAMLSVWPPFPPPITIATLADLWFAPTAGFVDLTAAVNRRDFIGVAGTAQNLGADGSAPFEVTPPVFLSSNGTPSSFAANVGRGGAFVISSGTLAAGASNPPGPAIEATSVVSAASLGNGVLGDYLNGNLYAFNPATLTDNGTQRRWVRRWRALPAGSMAAKRFPALVIDMQTGIGASPTVAPQVMLRWSDDGGKTWSDPRMTSAGKLGQTAWTVKFNRLGSTRRVAGSDRIFELSSSDPFRVAIFGAEIDAE